MSMDAGTKRRLVLGLVAGWISKLSGTVIQLIQVPFFLHFWPEGLYGEWMVIIVLPNYLALSNQGFGNVAGNEMTMAEARGDREAALRAFQSSWWFLLGVGAVVLAITAALLTVVPVGRLLGLHFISDLDARWIIGYLAVTVMISQVETILSAAYRAVGRAPYGSFIKTMAVLVAFLAMLVPVGLGYGARITALVYAIADGAGTVVLMAMVRRDVPWIRFGWKHARWSEIRTMAPPAFAFLGFPLGNAFNLGGTQFAVLKALGPVPVVVFSTARTVSRVALQMVQMVNQSFEPEFSTSFAQSNHGLIRTLHRRACQMALILSLGIVAAMIVGGPFFLHHWTGGKVPPSRPLLTILLSVVVVYSLWSTSSTILTATNQHKRLAGVYMAATGVTVLITFFAARTFGLYGAAASLLLSEFLMNLYVLPSTLHIAHDSLPGFLRSMLDVPPQLHPRALLRRLKRTRPALENEG